MKLVENMPRGNWLSAAALWVVIAAWAAAGIWGWTQNAAGIMVPITVAMTVGCQVFAARAAANAAAIAGSRRLGLIGLGVACLLFTGWSGKQAIATNEAQRSAPYEQAMAAKAAAVAALAKVEAEINAVPPLRSDIPAMRLATLQAARTTELARLEPLRAAAQARVEAIATPARPAPQMPSPLQWAIVALIECLEFFGFWAIGMRHARKEAASEAPSNVTEFNAGRELVRKRWAKK
ncbi:MAG: hypothetical protein EBR82_07935 [Caulobacteraceae bacterium]|nr:hypothetical protein [Caulobacteraceae bacterium]